MPNRQIVGTIAANDGRLILTIDDQGSAIALVSGTWTGTLEAQVSADGVTWATTNVFDVGGNAAVRSWTANGQYMVLAIGGVTAIAIHATAWTSGTAGVRLSATGAQFSAMPTIATQAVSGSVKLIDGTTVASVKDITVAYLALLPDVLTELQLIRDLLETIARSDSRQGGIMDQQMHQPRASRDFDQLKIVGGY